MKEISFADFLKEFDESVHDQLRVLALSHMTDGFILFENQMFDSSSFGKKTAVVFGPDRTYKTPEMAEGKWINDLPSQRQYAVAFCRTKQGGNHD